MARIAQPARDPRSFCARDRVANRDDGARELSGVFAQRTLAEWKSILATARGV